MRRLPLLLAGLLLAVHAAPPDTDIVITSDGGGEFDLGTGLIHYQRNVRVNDPTGFTLTCEDLLANIPGGQNRLESITATTNVVIEIQRPPEKAGAEPFRVKTYSARAVYTATNDLITLSGDARIEFPQGSLASDEPIVYDRRTGSVRSTGRWKTVLKPGALNSTGFLAPKATNAPAANK